MGKSNNTSKAVQTDLATMLGVMQDLCPDDDAIVTCLAAMMDKGEIRRPLWPLAQGAAA